MKRVPIGDLVRPVASANPASLFGASRFTYIDIASVSQLAKTIETPQELPGEDAPSRARQILEPDDVLVSTVRPNLNAVAKLGRDHAGAVASTGFAVLRTKPDQLDPSYLFHWVQSLEFIAEMVRKASGQSYPAVSDRIIKASEIPLPPLAEQKRIAAILDQAARLTRLRAEALARLDTLGQAIFHEMFGDSHSFPARAINEFADVKGGKRLPKGADYSDAPTSHPYIRVSDLSPHRVSTENIKFISDEIQRGIQRYIVNEGDVIISIAGSIGITAAVPSVLNGANLTENAAKITPMKGEAFDPIYLDWALSDEKAQSQIAAKTGQVTIGKLALFRIEQIEVPFPPLETQRDFARRISRMNQEQERLRMAGRATDTLFASLQHRAFRGEL